MRITKCKDCKYEKVDNTERSDCNKCGGKLEVIAQENE